MAKELPYFKFYTGEWLQGDITVCSMSAQGLFINLCVYYWGKEGSLTLTSAQHRFNTCSTDIEELLKMEIIKVQEEKIIIDFLDEQFSEFEILRKKKSRAGKASAKIRKVNTRSTGEEQVMNKREEIREDKDKEKKNINPTLDEVKQFFKENGYNAKSAIKAFKIYDVANWVDTKGNKILDWRQKMITVWFTDENRLKSGKVNSGDSLPANYGQIGPNDIPMPDSFKNRRDKIGEELK